MGASDKNNHPNQASANCHQFENEEREKENAAAESTWQKDSGTFQKQSNPPPPPPPPFSRLISLSPGRFLLSGGIFTLRLLL